MTLPTTQTERLSSTPRYPFIPPTFTPDIDWSDPHSIKAFVQSLDAPLFAPCMAEVYDGTWGIWFVGLGFEG